MLGFCRPRCGKLRLDFFFLNKHFLNHLNHTNLVLIPKKNQNEYPSDYRPIALYNVLYKLVTKILANRIKPILHRLIYSN